MILSRKSCAEQGFTLVELIVVVVIIAVLSAIAFPALSSAKKTANRAEEVSGAKQLIAGYLLYAGENDGRLMEGYTQPAPGTVKDDKGNNLAFPASGRYPWRIAPYLNMNLKGSAYVNGQKKKFDNDGAYAASTYPSFGVNATFVGGNTYTGSAEMALSEAMEKKFGNFCVKRLADAAGPASLIVFASSRGQGEDSVVSEGYYQVLAPNLQSRRWPDKYDEKLEPEKFGHVHPRYTGGAVTAMLDGHVAVLTYAELLDMRRWSNQAFEQDNPNFTVKKLQ